MRRFVEDARIYLVGVLSLPFALGGMNIPAIASSWIDLSAPTCRPIFSDSTLRDVGVGPLSLLVADFNEDGNLDAITRNNASLDMSVLLGHGDGTFGPEQRCCSYWDRLIDIDLGDFDGDGFTDIVGVLLDWSNYVIFWGRGDGTFEPGQMFRTPPFPSRAIFADLDGDGRQDLVYTTDVDPWLNVVWGDGTRNPSQTSTVPLPLTVNKVGVGDVNGDGRMDLVVASPVDSCVYVVPGLGNRRFGPANLGMCVSAGGTKIAGFSLGDLNHDKCADIVFTMIDAFTGVAGVGLGRPDGRFEAHSVTFPGSSPHRPWIADLDGDGYGDVLIPNTFLSNKVTVLLGNGDGTFRYMANLPAGGPSAMAVAAGDFSNDGSPDLLTSSGMNNVSLYLNHQQHVAGSARFRPPVVPLGSGTWVDVTLPPTAARPWEAGNVRLTRNGQTIGWATASLFDSTSGTASFSFGPKVVRVLAVGDQRVTTTGCDSTGTVFHADGTLRVVWSTSRTLWQSSAPGRTPITVQTNGLAQSNVTYRIFDCRGRLVRRSSVPLGPLGVITWDGRSGGESLPSGVYLFKLEGTAQNCKLVVLR